MQRNVSDLLIYVRDFSDVLDLLIFDRCVAVSSFSDLTIIHYCTIPLNSPVTRYRARNFRTFFSGHRSPRQFLNVQKKSRKEQNGPENAIFRWRKHAVLLNTKSGLKILISN
jgi:hypothetical protein